jgi:hypothetical protein
MTALDLQARINSYVRVTSFPRSLFISEDGRIVGTWIMGNDYRVQSRYLVAALPGDMVDCNADLTPTYVDDAQRLQNVPLGNYDLVLADPPYSVEDAERYQTTMVKPNLVMQALQGLLPGAHVVWMDQVLPMCRTDAFTLESMIGTVKSTNHRFRIITIFRNLAPMRVLAGGISHRACGAGASVQKGELL